MVKRKNDNRGRGQSSSEILEGYTQFNPKFFLYNLRMYIYMNYF